MVLSGRFSVICPIKYLQESNKSNVKITAGGPTPQDAVCHPQHQQPHMLQNLLNVQIHQFNLQMVSFQQVEIELVTGGLWCVQMGTDQKGTHMLSVSTMEHGDTMDNVSQIVPIAQLFYHRYKMLNILLWVQKVTNQEPFEGCLANRTFTGQKAQVGLFVYKMAPGPNQADVFQQIGYQQPFYPGSQHLPAPQPQQRQPPKRDPAFVKISILHYQAICWQLLNPVKLEMFGVYSVVVPIQIRLKLIPNGHP